MPSAANTNKELVEQAQCLQQRSHETVYRVQRQLHETEELGENALRGLEQQRARLDGLQTSTDQLGTKLDHTNRLLNRFDRWAGHWGGANRREAQKEGKQKAMEIIDERKLKAKENLGDARISKNTAWIKNETAMEQQKHKAGKDELFSQRTNYQSHCVKASEAKYAQQLDEETEAEIQCLESADRDLDDLMGAMGESLDRLQLLSKSLGDNAVKSGEAMEATATKLDSATRKQTVVLGRLRRNLNK